MPFATLVSHFTDDRSRSQSHAARLRLAGFIGAWIVLAALLPAPPADGAMDKKSNCCWANGTPGCHDADCEALVCDQDPFCCDIQWDQLCVDQAQDLCEVCGAPSSDCCYANGTPGCEYATCEDVVCGTTPSCCEDEWDETCASIAETWCVPCSNNGFYHPVCSFASGHCCDSNGTPGCKDVGCCQVICDYDPFCCDAIWDDICADIAVQSCELPGSPCPGSNCYNSQAGDCCAANGSPSCHDPDCCFQICASDVTCCTTEWDEYCAAAASVYCDSCENAWLGDLNGDSVVDGTDLGILLANWGDCPVCNDCIADLIGDCTVDGADLSILLANWG